MEFVTNQNEPVRSKPPPGATTQQAAALQRAMTTSDTMIWWQALSMEHTAAFDDSTLMGI